MFHVFEIIKVYENHLKSTYKEINRFMAIKVSHYRKSFFSNLTNLKNMFSKSYLHVKVQIDFQ